MALQFPEFLQTKTYTALRDRLAMAHGGQVQPGVWDLGDFKVTQGTNMVLNVAAGFALVPANNAGNAGLYHIQNDATMTVTIPAAHATLPRVDQVVIDVSDSAHGGDAGDTPVLTVVQGTATSGATLTNRTGAAALPNNTLRIADIFVGPAVTSITTTNIMDRRAWARGAYSRQQKTSSAVNATTVLGAVDSATLQARIECSGAPIRVMFNAPLGSNNTAGSGATAGLLVDGANVDGFANLAQIISPAANQAFPLHYAYTIAAPTPGTHLFTPTFAAITSGTATLTANATIPILFVVEEIARQNANNGTS